ncbi:MAG: hypothetical protein COX62_00045 [Deltaproteobacteria bacterium CG_4_10_14_0_2_um_filter_43_8]|nr:MAG: hypothetical protein COV43_02395 [Deltaproteobacteria bacterium CG11_big_fil_rev_8_21_14_0_20_42_23]PJA22409.1 MAG: hypothetical protein COX62_00045 [Deltaproteobacteria bacterium CG_4_10_14_0_2_um_filter_43_8]PJC64230.1 MAG: hypothetical protein CO021_05395 [Deltaproteobacteria bacterium CG_4_9_14_0_2_um_filter_42_21]
MNTFTPQQTEASQNLSQSLAVIAGAGTGKTSVLVSRMLNIVEEYKSLEILLAITFTEKAALEMKERLKKSLPPQLALHVETAHIGTFHAFCLKTLKQFGHLIHLSPNAMQVLAEEAVFFLTQKIIKETFKQLILQKNKHAHFLAEKIGIKASTSLLTELLQNRWHAQTHLSKLKPDEEQYEVLHAAHQVFLLCEHELDVYYSTHACIDFQGLELKTLELFEQRPEVPQYFQNKMKHILVDEFQDTNDVQNLLIKHLYQPKKNKLFIVGDPRQSIYRFRGANVHCFTEMLHLIENTGGKSIVLQENFRSKKGILDFVNHCSQTLEDSLEKENVLQDKNTRGLKSHSQLEYDDDVLLLHYPVAEKETVDQKRTHEAYAMANYILSLVQKKQYLYSDIALLFQASTKTYLYQKIFKEHGVPFLANNISQDISENTAFHDILSLLKFAHDREDETALVALLRSPFIGLSDENIFSLSLQAPLKKSAFQNEKANEILSSITLLSKHCSASELLHALFFRTGYKIFSEIISNNGLGVSPLNTLISLISTFEKNHRASIKDCILFLEQNKERKKKNNSLDPYKKNAVHIMTVHSSKGLEYPVVILPELFRAPQAHTLSWCFSRQKGIAVKTKKSKNPLSPLEGNTAFTQLCDFEKEALQEESLRLLYVALTRAKQKLVFLVADESKTRKGSIWLPLIQKALLEVKSSVFKPNEENERELIFSEPEIQTFTRSNVEGKIHSQSHKKQTLSISQLETYVRCPQEYYLKYILKLPGTVLFAKKASHLPADIKGSIIHATLENLNTRDKKEIYTLLEKQCYAHHLLPSQNILFELHSTLTPFLNHPYFEQITEGKKEFSFIWDIDSAYLRGKVDWVKPLGDALEIVDFKTDRIESGTCAEHAKHYHLQMMCYALAIEEVSKQKVNQVSLFYFNTGELISTSLTEQMKQSTKTELRNIVDKINSFTYSCQGLSLPCESASCTCPYHINKLCSHDRSKKGNHDLSNTLRSSPAS